MSEKNHSRPHGYPFHWTDKQCDVHDALEKLDEAIRELNTIMGEEVYAELASTKLEAALRQMNRTPHGVSVGSQQAEVRVYDEYEEKNHG